MAEYIEREALLCELDKALMETNPDGQEQIGVLQSRRIARLFPVADVAPVVRGRWCRISVFDDFIMRCSHCEKAGFSYWAYCPHCGAKMDQEG